MTEWEQLRQELALDPQRLETQFQAIAEEYGIDFALWIKGEIPEQPVKGIRKVLEVCNQQGKPKQSLVEEYIEKRVDILSD